MPGAACKSLATVSVLLSMAALAEDAPPAEADAVGEEWQSVVELLYALDTASRWRLMPGVALSAPPYVAADPYYDFDFQDNSSLARLGRLHSLSLLTLGEVGNAQLFLGVNEDGLLGVHFNAFPSEGGEGLLEMARMPYLAEEEADGENGL